MSRLYSSTQTGVRIVLLLLLCALLLTAQQPDTRLNNYYSPEAEAELSARFVKQLQNKITATQDARLDRIGHRLTPCCPHVHFQFFVFDGGQPSEDKAPAAAFPADWRHLQINEAIAVADGPIFVPRALLTRDDTQLTAVLAHAMAHIVLRHATIGLTRGELAQVEVQSASRSMPEEASARVRAVALKRFVFDRKCEIAADVYAVTLLREAGADPSILLAYLQTLPTTTIQEFSTYPTPAERINAVQAAIAASKH